MAAPKQSSGASAQTQVDADDSDGDEHEAHEVSTSTGGDVTTSGTDPTVAPEADAASTNAASDEEHAGHDIHQCSSLAGGRLGIDGHSFTTATAAKRCCCGDKLKKREHFAVQFTPQERFQERTVEQRVKIPVLSINQRDIPVLHDREEIVAVGQEVVRSHRHAYNRSTSKLWRCLFHNIRMMRRTWCSEWRFWIAVRLRRHSVPVTAAMRF